MSAPPALPRVGPPPPPVTEFHIVIPPDCDRLAERRARRRAMLAASFLASVAAHLAVVIVLLLVIIPVVRRTVEVLTVELAMEEPELVALTELDPVTEITDLGLPDVPPPTDPATLDASRLRPSVLGPLGGPGHSMNLGASDGAGDPSPGRATFFGSLAYGNEFLYIVDVSGSMNEKKGPSKETRLSRALEELVQSIEQLSEDQYFYILLFATETRLMMDEEKSYPVMVRATVENKIRVKKWIDSVRSGGGTHPQEALRVGLRMNPSAVFFLSDGEFSKARNRREGLLGEQNNVLKIIDTNNLSGAPIHTIAFEDPVNSATLSRMSSVTGGEHRYVAPK